MIATITQKRLFTVEEYLAFEESKQEKYEFHQGKLKKIPGGTLNHNKIAANIIFAIKQELRKSKRKYHVATSDMKIWIEAYNHIVYPDVVIICEKVEYYNNRKDIITNPLLIVEVLSSSTKNYDLSGKFEKYQTLSALKEYVLVEQTLPAVIAYHREEEDLWRVQRSHDLENGEIHLKSIDCKIALTDIYEMIDWENEEA